MSSQYQDDVIRTNAADYKRKIDHYSNVTSQNDTLKDARKFGSDRNLFFERLANKNGKISLWNLPGFNRASPWVRSYVNVSVVGLVGFVGVQAYINNNRKNAHTRDVIAYQKPKYAEL